MNSFYRARRLVRLVHLDLSYRCNFACVHCAVDPETRIHERTRPELTTAECLDLFEQMAGYGVFSITLSGGEVALRPDLGQLLGALRRLHFDISIKSNGALLSPALVETMTAAGVRKLDVTVFSHDKKINDAVTRSRGSLDRVLRGALLAQNAGILVSVSIPVMKETLDTFDETLRLVDGLGLRALVGHSILGDSPKDSRWDMNLDAEQKNALGRRFLAEVEASRELDERKQRAQGEKGAKAGPQEPPPEPMSPNDVSCGAGIDSAYISPYGDVHACALLGEVIGSVREQSFADVMAARTRDRFITLDLPRHARTLCTQCVLFPYCNPCMAANERLTGDVHGRHPETCRFFAKRHRASGGRRVGRDYVFDPHSGTPDEER
jgi:radical SAM protein with 4Fe4S-binding SPASM domain